MKRAFTRISAVVLFAGLAMAGSAMAVPPKDADVDEFVKAVSTSGEGIKPEDRAAVMAARNKAIEEGIAKLSMAEATFEQIDKVLTSVGWTSRKVVDAVLPRIEEIAKEKTAAGAKAAAYQMVMVPPAAMVQGDTKANAEATKARAEKVAGMFAALLKHPGLGEALKTGINATALSTGMRMPMATMMSSGVLALVEPVLEMEMTAEAASAFSSVIDAVAGATEGVDSATRGRMLDKASAMCEKASGKVDMTKPNAKNMQDRLKAQAKKANGPFARGTLIGGMAPEVKFTWSSDGKLKSLADLKGKVVVVDFWATWCGPCISSFPKVRDLVERYNGYDVAVVGVTSVQGFHIERKDGEKTSNRIDCKDDVAKETGLMPVFIKDMKMTWPVVFSEDSCFNPMFGVNGIPHVAIIDPSGKVRYNGLHPMDEGKLEKIDGLLKEFNLKAPAAEAKKEEPKKEEAKPEKKDDKK